VQTREQIYANSAYRHISTDVEQKERSYQKKYGSMAHKLPVLIRSAGLAQALQFVESRGSDEQRKLLEHLATSIGYPSKEELLAKSRSEGLNEYIHLTEKTLGALLWYKRFAQSVLKVDAGDSDDNPTEEGE
jgi:CRISPR-associated protein Cmr5